MVNAHCPGPRRNPKSEVRKPKEIRNPKPEIRNKSQYPSRQCSRPAGAVVFGTLDFPRWCLFRISGFGFRASDFLLAALVVSAIVNSGGIGVSAAEDSIPNWPQFRGPNCSGVALQARPPVHISPTNSVLWRIEAPWSPSSPCIWGDRIFLTAFVGDQLQTRGYDRRNGQLLWSAGVKATKLEAFNQTENSPAAPTPATDGRHVVSYFGSFGLICHDPEGRELWRHRLPVAMSGCGFGSGTSPIIEGQLVILDRDQDQNSSLLAVEVETGKTAWETPRPDATGSFGTPVIWSHGDADDVVVPGCLRLKGYDVKTGKERWRAEGVAAITCPTPVVGDGWLFFAAWSPGKADSPWPSWDEFLEKFDQHKHGLVSLDELSGVYRDLLSSVDVDHDGKIIKAEWDIFLARNAKARNVMVALKPGGRGDITQTHVAWEFTRGLPYVASPLFYQGRVYTIKDGGMLSSLDARTGQPYYLQERLGATRELLRLAGGGRWTHLPRLAGRQGHGRKSWGRQARDSPSGGLWRPHFGYSGDRGGQPLLAHEDQTLCVRRLVRLVTRPLSRHG